MKIVNTSKIPDALFRYLSVDNYDYEEKGDSLSTTELLNPIQIVILKRRYWKDMTIDAIDRLWQMLGNGVHAILEKEKGIEKIERLKWTVEGREISGRWDRIFNNEISDYKVTSAWSVAYGSRDSEWRMQLSIYRWLYWKVKGRMLNSVGYIVALLRDWAERDKAKKNYPQAPAIQKSFDLLTIEDTEAWVTKRVQDIALSEKLSDDKLPECTDEERWYSETKKVYNRCIKYCEVASFCSQLKKEKELESIPDAEPLFDE